MEVRPSFGGHPPVAGRPQRDAAVTSSVRCAGAPSVSKGRPVAWGESGSSTSVTAGSNCCGSEPEARRPVDHGLAVELTAHQPGHQVGDRRRLQDDGPASPARPAPASTPARALAAARAPSAAQSRSASRTDIDRATPSAPDSRAMPSQTAEVARAAHVLPRRVGQHGAHRRGLQVAGGRQPAGGGDERAPPRPARLGRGGGGGRRVRVSRPTPSAPGRPARARPGRAGAAGPRPASRPPGRPRRRAACGWSTRWPVRPPSTVS